MCCCFVTSGKYSRNLKDFCIVHTYGNVWDACNSTLAFRTIFFFTCRICGVVLKLQGHNSPKRFISSRLTRGIRFVPRFRRSIWQRTSQSHMVIDTPYVFLCPGSNMTGTELPEPNNEVEELDYLTKLVEKIEKISCSISRYKDSQTVQPL